MEAKELRIENFVEYNGSITQVNIPLLNEVFCKYTNEPINPIPLTEEWLRKFGFDDSEYKDGFIGVYFKTNFILDFVLKKPQLKGEWNHNFYTFDLGQHRIVYIKYVHQLQNFFYEVTTTELKYNPN